MSAVYPYFARKDKKAAIITYLYGVFETKYGPPLRGNLDGQVKVLGQIADRILKESEDESQSS